MTSRSGSATGSFRSSIWSMSVKMAVLAPMPRARDRIATSANSGLRRSPRTARRRSARMEVIGALDGSGRQNVWFGCEARSRNRLPAEVAMDPITRREALASGTAAILARVGAPLAAAAQEGKAVTKGRLKQSVSRWCYGKIPMPEFCKAVASMGLTAIDLLEEKEWSIVRDFGLICSMGYAGGGTIPDGLNVRANHDAIVKNFEEKIPIAAKLQVPNVITFFGNRRGMPDAEAIDNCIVGLNRIKKIGEDHNVMICVE